jgi:N-acetylneuraminic acid mutarotase
MRGAGNVWEISVPNGTYTVRIVAGDPGAYDSTYAIAAEGATIVSGKPTSSVRWFDGTTTVTVADGRLTVTNAAGSSNNKIAFIDITGAGGTTTPTVSVSASDALALENPPGDIGAFTVSRTGPTDAPLAVNLTVGGSATGGADYAALGTSVVIPAGASSVVVPVVPADDALVEGSESVTLAVAAGAGYDVASPSSASVTIADDDRPAGTTLSWREVTPATVGRSEAMGAVVNGKLYHFGGYVDTTYKPTTRADVYDPAANRWAQMASLPFGVSHAGTAVVGDSVYFAGGYPATSTSQSFATVRVTRYDTTTNTYQTNLPSLPLSRGGGALVALGRKLHFFGGSDSSRRDAAQHWALDLDNLAGGWVARAPLPVATNHVAGAVVGGRIYAVGGQQGQDAAAVHRADVQMYDPATDRWTARAPMPAAKSHITNSTIVRDGRIIVLGGMGTGERVLGTVNSYDPTTNTWSSLTSLPTGRMSGVADLLPDGRIVFATGGSGFRTNTWIGSFA